MPSALKGLNRKSTGSGQPPEPEPPADLLRDAEAGAPEAQTDLGRWFAETLSRHDAARFWWQRAAAQGYARAMHNLGVLTLHDGTRDEAMTWFTQASALGWDASTFVRAMLLEEAGDVEAAAPLYRELGNRGHALAQNCMGRLALDHAEPPRYESARLWSELAAAQGEPWAQARLGTIYHEGLGVERDPEQAAAWFLQAAQRGHARAQLMIGAAHHIGVGVPVDRIKAVRWLRLSRDQGDELAIAYLPDIEAELTADERRRLDGD